MHRRSFLTRCGLAAVGTTLLPGLFPAVSGLQAAGAPLRPPLPQLTDADRALLSLLAIYSSDVTFSGGQVFARAAGITPEIAPTTQLLVQVAGYASLIAFLRSKAEKSLGFVRAAGNTLSFRFMGTAYSLTNQPAADFAADRLSQPESAAPVPARLRHETMLYHAATDTLSDPQFALEKQRIDLVARPTGGVKAQFETLVRGWLEANRYGLKLSRQFRAFQDELLTSTPTSKAAKKVVESLLGSIAALAGAFDVEALRPLVTSPLVSASLRMTLGLGAADVLAAVAKRRAELASSDYPDAALWLAVLLEAPLQEGTAGRWIELSMGDDATGAALSSASELVQTSVSQRG